MRSASAIAAIVLASWPLASSIASQQPVPAIPSAPMTFGTFRARFDPGGTFSLESDTWRGAIGSWKINRARAEIELTMADGPGGCLGIGRYRYQVEGTRLRFDLVSDACSPRRMIFDGSTWSPAGEVKALPLRRIVRTAGDGGALPDREPPAGSWPAFRGPGASGVMDGQDLPDRWDAQAGENVLWRTPIPGLAHSSPVVWGHRVFVTSAVSSDPDATFRPGLYGEGDASADRTRQRWMIYAIEKTSGKMLWERVAHEGEPADRRHIKSTYASSTPATDGRMVVAWFGSQGIFAYDVEGNFRWKVDLGRLDVGAYEIPTYEWGPASSPIIWQGLVIVQCDTQADSFLLALHAETGQLAWKSDRIELPSWGTPTVADTASGPELVTNGANFVRGYDPRTGEELWRLGRSSKITAPTPVFSNGLFVIVSGRAPERPIFVVRAGSRGDLTLPEGKRESDAVVWSRSGRGSYMPTPLVYDGILYTLDNNGVFDAYDVRTGKELYRQRLPRVGNGFSSSPVAADGKIYLSSEDGDMLVVVAGSKFALLSTNSMGEPLMASPALSEGVIYVRSAKTLFAIGRQRQ